MSFPSSLATTVRSDNLQSASAVLKASACAEGNNWYAILVAQSHDALNVLHASWRANDVGQTSPKGCEMIVKFWN